MKEDYYNVLLFAYAFEKYKYGIIDGIIENYRELKKLNLFY